VACRPIRENATLRTQTSGGTRRSARDLAAAPSRRQPNGHSCYTGRRVFGSLSITGSLIRRWVGAAACPGTAVIDGSPGRRSGVVSGQHPGNFGGSTFSNLREVIMTMSEYEERFRPTARSLHQTFAEVRGPNRGGRRSRRLWVTAALVGAMAMTSKTALHHSSHAYGSQVPKSAVQTCDFFHR
jgi:hypothetical protein